MYLTQEVSYAQQQRPSSHPASGWKHSASRAPELTVLAHLEDSASKYNFKKGEFSV